MRLAHEVRMTVFVKPEDIASDKDIGQKIKDKITFLSGLDLEAEKLAITLIKNEGFNNREIHIYELKLRKETHINIFLKKFSSLLNDAQKALLADQKDSRLDENLDFFIRLSKTDLMEDRLVLTDSGDCFHIRISIAAFPKKREVALDISEKLFSM